MQETTFYLENNGYRLYSIAYLPETPARCGVLLCHPFAEEKLWSQRVYVSFARLLARKGYYALRVDCMGHGDSEGDFSQATIDTRLSDIGCGLDYLKRVLGDATPLGLAGVRLGATLAALAAEARQDVRYLALWEPIVDGASYMRQLFRINIATQTAVFKQVIHTSGAMVEQLKSGKTVNIDGYEIAYAFYEQLSRIKLLEGKSTYEGQVLLASISKNKEMQNKSLLRLKQKYANCTYTSVVEELFWNNVPAFCRKAEHLFDATLQWLEGKGHGTR